MIDEAGSIERDRVEQPTISNEEAAVVSAAAVMDEEEKVSSYSMEEGGARGPEDKTACLTSMTSMDRWEVPRAIQLYQLWIMSE